MKLISAVEACIMLSKFTTHVTKKETATHWVSIKQDGQEFNLYLFEEESYEER